MSWFYDTPDWVTLPAFVVLFVGGSVAIVIVLRPSVRRSVVDPAQWDRVLGYTSSTFGVFFGILLALVAVTVYGNYSDAHSAGLEETSQIGALYRGANALPAVLRDEVHESLRDYVRTVIHQDWPEQADGQVAVASTAKVDAIESRIYSFNPETLGQQAVYMRLLATFDGFVEARRARIDATTLQLPPLFWVVIWIGALINAILIAFIDVKAFRLHVMMAALLALFVGLVIFLTADMDHPYAGSIAVGPGDFERILQVIDR